MVLVHFTDKETQEGEVVQGQQSPCKRAEDLQLDAFRGGYCLQTQQGLIPSSLPEYSFFRKPLLCLRIDMAGLPALQDTPPP